MIRIRIKGIKNRVRMRVKISSKLVLIGISVTISCEYE
jgi:hypothetical protein